MFLPLPQLDDTRWADLVAESRALLPFHAPEWTDHNASDPGITLVELLAWITEMQVFQLDQVPAAHRRAFLALVGVRPRPPRPARTVLRLSVPDGAAPAAVAAGLACEGAYGTGTAGLRTRHALQVVPGAVGELQAVDAAGAGRDLTPPWRRGELLAPLGTDPRPGASLVVALTAAPPDGATLTLAVTTAGGRGAPAPAAHHDAAVAWEAEVADGRWAAAEVAADGTRALTRDGRVELRLPQPPVAVSTPAGERWRLRVRHAAGRYDAAPLLRDVVLNGVLAEQAVALTARLPVLPGAVVTGVPAAGTDAHLALELDAAGAITGLDVTGEGGPPLRVLGYRAPAAGAAGTLEIAARVLGRSTGDPEQRFVLPGAPVDAASVQLFTGRGSRWRRYALHDDLVAAGPAAARAVLDATTGRITFGDGRRGLVPPAGDIVLAASRSTLAGGGNLAAGTVGRLAGPAPTAAGLAVAQPWPATGGAAAETLGEAEVRAAALVTQPTRAVTLADTEALARSTPGGQLARVLALGDHHPAFPCVTATGMVTVVVVPHLPPRRPVPSAGLRRAVAARLAPARLVGTRIVVVGPSYVTVAVRATVAALGRAVAADVRARVLAALDAFLDPLAGGPAGTGWPFGRDVVRTEVLRVIDDVPGVDHVLELDLVGPGGASCGNLCLGPLELTTAGAHVIEVTAP